MSRGFFGPCFVKDSFILVCGTKDSKFIFQHSEEYGFLRTNITVGWPPQVAFASTHLV